MDKEKSDKKQDEPVDEELEKLLAQVQDPLPAGDQPKPLESQPPAPKEPVRAEVVEVEQENLSVDNDIKVVLGKFHDVTDKIIHNYDCDRDEIGDAVERLRDLMMAAGRKPPEHVVAGYVSALKTKTDANTNIIRLLDAFAKIISSTKNTNIISQSTNIDLTSLLSGDEEDEDE